MTDTLAPQKGEVVSPQMQHPNLMQAFESRVLLLSPHHFHAPLAGPSRPSSHSSSLPSVRDVLCAARSSQGAAGSNYRQKSLSLDAGQPAYSPMMSKANYHQSSGHVPGEQSGTSGASGLVMPQGLCTTSGGMGSSRNQGSELSLRKVTTSTATSSQCTSDTLEKSLDRPSLDQHSTGQTSWLPTLLHSLQAKPGQYLMELITEVRQASLVTLNCML